MDSKQRASTGGKAWGKVQRDRAIESYYLDPKHCLACGLVIHVGSGKVSETKKKKFCDNSCAATLNNKGVRRRTRCEPRTFACEKCFRTLPNGLSVRCLQCRLYGLTKGELFTSRSWQAARSAIQAQARELYLFRGNRQCFECGYDSHIEVCHLRSVASFPPETKISEINDPKNLIGLCRTHHWEYDHGLLVLDLASPTGVEPV